MVLLVPGFFTANFFADLGGLYVFGSLLAFALAHAAVVALRIRRPDAPRPFKLSLNIKAGKYELPVSAMLGFLGTATVWVIIISTQAYSRWFGLAWMALGFVIYFIYRKSQHLPLTYTPKRPASKFPKIN